MLYCYEDGNIVQKKIPVRNMINPSRVMLWFFMEIMVMKKFHEEKDNNGKIIYTYILNKNDKSMWTLFILYLTHWIYRITIKWS